MKFASEYLTAFYFILFQFDADRDEEEVFHDISLAVDNKLFPHKDHVAGGLMITKSFIGSPLAASEFYVLDTLER